LFWWYSHSFLLFCYYIPLLLHSAFTYCWYIYYILFWMTPVLPHTIVCSLPAVDLRVTAVLRCTYVARMAFTVRVWEDSAAGRYVHAFGRGWFARTLDTLLVAHGLLSHRFPTHCYRRFTFDSLVTRTFTLRLRATHRSPPPHGAVGGFYVTTVTFHTPVTHCCTLPSSPGVTWYPVIAPVTDIVTVNAHLHVHRYVTFHAEIPATRWNLPFSLLRFYAVPHPLRVVRCCCSLLPPEPPFRTVLHSALFTVLHCWFTPTTDSHRAFSRLPSACVYRYITLFALAGYGSWFTVWICSMTFITVPHYVPTPFTRWTRFTTGLRWLRCFLRRLPFPLVFWFYVPAFRSHSCLRASHAARVGSFRVPLRSPFLHVVLILLHLPHCCLVGGSTDHTRCRKGRYVNFLTIFVGTLLPLLHHTTHVWAFLESVVEHRVRCSRFVDFVILLVIRCSSRCWLQLRCYPLPLTGTLFTLVRWFILRCWFIHVRYSYIRDHTRLTVLGFGFSQLIFYAFWAGYRRGYLFCGPVWTTCVAVTALLPVATHLHYTPPHTFTPTFGYCTVGCSRSV